MSTQRAPPSGLWSRFASTWGLPPMSVREVPKMAVATSELEGINRFKFHVGKLEGMKRGSARALEIARAEDSRTLADGINLNADESEGTVVGRYPDADALV